MFGSKDLQPSTSPFFSQHLPPQPIRYEASLQLLGLKLTHLILAVRFADKGEKAASEMRRLYPKANIEVWALDLCSYDSVQTFAHKASIRLQRIDNVILNAGRARLQYNKVESTGHEETFQVNYLSTILLAILLLPILKRKAPPPPPPWGKPAHLTISSAALTLACKLLPIFPDDPANFDRGETYRVSKLLAHLFIWTFVDYVSADDVVINLADPAFVRGTDFARDLESSRGAKLAFSLFALVGGARSPPQVGTSCYIEALVNQGKESHGCFLMSWKVHPYAKRVIQKVWDETLADFEFANTRGIIESMRSWG
ncbi:retinol dehydrogenase 13 [Rhypophila decipiens]|uniref:Retinol dehydrogenase 13 n=1 Tax=Rhypophila decipiens TaxID=261697 RepID=A0AAN6Y0B8_9PEZI|nr:retinol dehydrogenase 13 [Rhypophila decipiens]